MLRLTRFNLIFLTLWLFSIGMMPLSGHAKTIEGSDSLRAAIECLTKNYPDRYPRGAEFLQRLDTLEKNPQSHAELKVLQREALLANPLLTSHPIAFVVRHQYHRDHHNTGTMFLTSEVNARSFQGGGAIRTIDFAEGGKVETLLELPEGVARDLEVDFDGGKLLFAMRRNQAENYHVFELIKQLAPSSTAGAEKKPVAGNRTNASTKKGPIHVFITPVDLQTGCGRHRSGLFARWSDRFRIDS